MSKRLHNNSDLANRYFVLVQLSDVIGGALTSLSCDMDMVSALIH